MTPQPRAAIESHRSEALSLTNQREFEAAMVTGGERLTLAEQAFTGSSFATPIDRARARSLGADSNSLLQSLQLVLDFALRGARLGLP